MRRSNTYSFIDWKSTLYFGKIMTMKRFSVNKNEKYTMAIVEYARILQNASIICAIFWAKTLKKIVYQNKFNMFRCN